MSRDTDKNLFIVSSMPRFYQQLLSRVASFDDLGNRIIRQIKAAHAFRQTEQVRELSRLLLNFPIKEYQLIAQYYLAWCHCREKRWDTDILEIVAEQSHTYRTRALMSLAAVEGYKQDYTAELFYFNEALKTSPGISDFIEISKAIAVVRAKEGFHKQSLVDFEHVLPILKHADSFAYYDYLNSYAVELGETGRKDEARNVINRVISSPLASAYPEWQETAKGLKEPSRAFISVPHIEHTPVEVEIKETPHASTESKPNQPGRVVAFPPLKEAPEPKRPDIIDSQEFVNMTLADKREFILAAVRTQLLPESEYDKMVFMLGLVKSGPADHVIDLEDKKTLDDLMVEWAHLIEPEQLAAVISALRDCEDDQRRVTIMDSMISRVFEYSRTRNITESDWRLKYECRLPKK